MKVFDCGFSLWEDHGLDIPHELETFNFSVTGTGHERIERLFQDGFAERGGRFPEYNEKHPEQRIAMWLCQHACSFVLFDTKGRSTVIGLERLRMRKPSGASSSESSTKVAYWQPDIGT